MTDWDYWDAIDLAEQTEYWEDVNWNPYTGRGWEGTEDD